MMSFRIACLLVLGFISQASAKPDPHPDPTKPETWTFSSRATAGTVTATGKASITLSIPESVVYRLNHDPVTGLQVGMTKEIIQAVPARKFFLGDELAKGRYVRSASPADTYRITDVRVGDLVHIHYDRRNGVDICQTICIRRRPQGRVPAAPGERPDAFRKHHEQMNADQDWEERKIPYPLKYAPTYRGNDGKFYRSPVPRVPAQPTQPPKS